MIAPPSVMEMKRAHEAGAEKRQRIQASVRASSAIAASASSSAARYGG
jgi:hypothetical protein